MCPLVCALQMLVRRLVLVSLMHVAAASFACVLLPPPPLSSMASESPSAIAAHSNRCRRNGATTAASHPCGTVRVACLSIMSADELDVNDDDHDEHDGDSQGLPTRVGGVRGDWRIERARLEWIERRAILQRKLRYGSFAQSSAIVQVHGLSTREEWLDWLELGEGRSPYVPSDPETYYGNRGEWLGWRIWLTGGP